MKSQTQKLFELLSDGLPHRTDSILAIVYGNDHLGLARVGARIWDIRRKYSCGIYGWKDKENKTLYWYQLKTPPDAQNAPTERVNGQEALFPLSPIEHKIQMPD